MRFCREFHCLPAAGGYDDQPMDVMVRWQAYLRAERDGQAMAQRIQEALASARTN